MEMNKVYKYCKCCICEGQLPVNPCMVQIPITITWEFPKWGNFLTGAQDQGVAFICDSCNISSMKYTDIKSVVEFFHNNGVRYHSITWTTGANNKLTAHLTKN